MKIRRLGGLPTVLAMALMVGSAAADDLGGESVSVPGAETTVVEQLLDIMLASGQITRDQYDALKAKAQEEQEAAAVAMTQAAREAPAVSEAGPTWKFKWKNGFTLERSDGAFKLAFGGRSQVDFASIWESNGLSSTVDGGGTGVECRRCRIFFEGIVYDRVIFKAQYDFAQPEDDDNPDFKDVWLGFKDLGPVKEIRIGHFKEPFVLEEWTSSKYLTFMERGLNNVFFPGRNMGLMLQGNLFQKRTQWQLGMFYNTNDQAFAFDDWGRQEYDLAARVVGTPIYADEGAKVLHVGAGYIHQFRDKDSSTIRYRQRPEAHLASRYADTQLLIPTLDPDDPFATQDIATEGQDVFNAELAGVWGRFSAQSEFTFSSVERPNGANPFFWGAYGYVSWFLTGEHRNYELGKGRFARVKPRANFNPFKGDWGGWEIAARFSYLDLNDADIRGGQMWDVTAAINWYLYPNLRMMLNYVHSDATNRQIVALSPDVDGSADILQTRFALDF